VRLRTGPHGIRRKERGVSDGMFACTALIDIVLDKALRLRSIYLTYLDCAMILTICKVVSLYQTMLIEIGDSR
jgi:hypothetical protein